MLAPYAQLFPAVKGKNRCGTGGRAVSTEQHNHCDPASRLTLVRSIPPVNTGLPTWPVTGTIPVNRRNENGPMGFFQTECAHSYRRLRSRYRGRPPLHPPPFYTGSLRIAQLCFSIIHQFSPKKTPYSILLPLHQKNPVTFCFRPGREAGDRIFVQTRIRLFRRGFPAPDSIPPSVYLFIPWPDFTFTLSSFPG